MSTHSSATLRQATPHATNSNTNKTISDAVRRRAHALINERFAEMICEAGSQQEMRAAALLVLMSTLENSTQPKVLANHVKHIAFTRCGELNCFGMVDVQIATIESGLLASTTAD